jgi:hypothetical protein
MIIALALMLAGVDAPPAMRAGALADGCRAGVSGDAAAADACRGYVSKVATTLTVDSAASGCMTQPRYDADDAVWAYVDWLAENPQEPDADASIGVMSALVSKWPCGWRDGATS